MSQFIKLNISIIYSNFASFLFYIHNTIVKNNITAHVRSAVWYIQKELYRLLTIKDGCYFELNWITYIRSPLVSHKLFKTEFRRENRNISLLLDCGITNYELRTVNYNEELYNLIDNKVIKRIKSMFPRGNRYHNFDLEIKKSLVRSSHMGHLVKQF